jgi:hypothetical protein
MTVINIVIRITWSPSPRRGSAMYYYCIFFLKIVKKKKKKIGAIAGGKKSGHYNVSYPAGTYGDGEVWKRCYVARTHRSDHGKLWVVLALAYRC